NAAPVITSNGGGATAGVSVSGGTTAVTTVTAADPDAGQTLSYAITGGTDAAKFQINAAAGVLSFIAAPDFSAPGDVGADNTYDVVVQVSDGAGGVDSQAIAVTVTAP
ncbi:cadherin repeat domain-containing protein, partial [Xanthobacter autotrophicus]|uniref:cadherin repeat domain-containing protein n=1 Tax=Xanthobacter autotrophicus TaxID=280 RepID=UPI00372C565D